MAKHIANELRQLIKRQIQTRENLGEHLLKVATLAFIASEDGFLNYPRFITSNYLWILKL